MVFILKEEGGKILKEEGGALLKEESVPSGSAADGALITSLQIILDGELLIDDFDDIDTATTSEAWFESVAPGHFKVGIRKDVSAILIASIAAIQNVGAGFTWELINKNASIVGFTNPAAEFKLYNSLGALADATIDLQLKGPKAM